MSLITFVHPGQEALVPELERALTSLGVPLTITSGYRSPEYNRRVGGAPQSRHISGTAADIDLSGRDEAERLALMRSMHEAGIPRFGLYGKHPNMLHVDMDASRGPWAMYDKSRWNLAEAPPYFQRFGEEIMQPDTIPFSDFAQFSPEAMAAGMQPVAMPPAAPLAAPLAAPEALPAYDFPPIPEYRPAPVPDLGLLGDPMLMIGLSLLSSSTSGTDPYQAVMQGMMGAMGTDLALQRLRGDEAARRAEHERYAGEESLRRQGLEIARRQALEGMGLQRERFDFQRQQARDEAARQGLLEQREIEEARAKALEPYEITLADGRKVTVVNDPVTGKPTPYSPEDLGLGPPVPSREQQESTLKRLETAYRRKTEGPEQFIDVWDRIRHIDPEKANPLQQYSLIAAYAKFNDPNVGITDSEADAIRNAGDPVVLGFLKDAIGGDLGKDKIRWMKAEIARTAQIKAGDIASSREIFSEQAKEAQVDPMEIFYDYGPPRFEPDEFLTPGARIPEGVGVPEISDENEKQRVKREALERFGVSVDDDEGRRAKSEALKVIGTSGAF